MLFKKKELRILWPFYLYYLIFGLSLLIGPFMIIYFRNLGLSFFKISIITTSIAVSMLLFEVPTGAFADSISRKYSVIIGFIVVGISTIAVPLVRSFYFLLLVFVMFGIGMTFISGAEQAWVIGNLNRLKRKDLYNEFFIKSKSLAAFGMIFAPFAASFLVKVYSISLLWFVFGFGFLFNAVLLSLFANELYRPRKLKIFETVKKTYRNSKEGLKFTFTHKIIFLLLLGDMFASMVGFGSDGWQPFLVSLSMPTHALGFMYSAMAAMLMITPFLSRLLMNMKVKNAVAITIFFRMLLLFSLLFLHPPLYLIAAAIFVLSHGLSSLTNPLVGAYFHKFVPEKIRATVVSVNSMANQVMMIIPILVAGILLDVFGPQKVLAFGSLFGIIAIIAYLKIKN